ncbi:MAG: hypothetical protein KY460_12745 [Actinobacteria bacterium]|nr:hypothetical protein [Actinomycetota bacterium]
MTRLILDAGALVAWERADRSMVAALEVAQRYRLDLRTTGIVVAQVWRDPAGRQARLARLLAAVDIVAVDEALGRRAGELLGMTGTSDAVDATVVAVAATGDRVLTSDVGDIERLASAAGLALHVTRC